MQLERRNKNKKFLILLFVLIVPLMQCFSLWAFSGEKVDESELVVFAVGFLGGDFDPHWYEYGSLGMYLLGFVYFVVGGFSVMLGFCDSLSDYAMHIVEGGFFYQLGRYVFSLIGVLTVLVYAKILKDTQPSVILLISYLVAAVFSSDAIYSANYIRTDLLVGFFVSVAVYSAIHSNKKAYLYVMAIVTAGAISTKISALSFLGYLFLYVFYHFMKKNIDFKGVIGVALCFLFFSFIFQPYVYFHGSEIFDSVVAYTGQSPSISIVLRGSETSSLLNRISVLYDIHNNFLGPYLMALSFLSLFLLFSEKYRAVAGAAFLILFFFLLSFYNSPEIREYWFLPSVALLRFLSFLTLLFILGILQDRLGVETFIKRPLIVLIFTGYIVLFFVIPSCKNLYNLYNSPLLRTTNKQDAKVWLEENACGKLGIYLDANFNHFLPKVYDPLDTNSAFLISRLFLYNRTQNEFLKSIFLDYLEDIYMPRVYHDTPVAYRKIESVRIDPQDSAGGLITINVNICSNDGECLEPGNVFARRANFSKKDSEYIIEPFEKDPYLVFDFPVPFLTNGNYDLSVRTSGANEKYGKIYLKYAGEPMSEKFSLPFLNDKHFKIPLESKFWSSRAFVKRLDSLGPKHKNEIFYYKNSFFVTSPDIYNRFFSSNTIGAANVRQQTNKVKLYYREMLNHRLVKRFDKRIGPIIEVYEII